MLCFEIGVLEKIDKEKCSLKGLHTLINKWRANQLVLKSSDSEMLC
jgi:hypothetical protein